MNTGTQSVIVLSNVLCDLSYSAYMFRFARIAGSNPAEDIGVSVSVVCCQVEVPASGWSPVQRSPTECVVCLSVIVKTRQWGGPGPLGAVAPWGGECFDYSAINVSNLTEFQTYVDDSNEAGVEVHAEALCSHLFNRLQDIEKLPTNPP